MDIEIRYRSDPPGAEPAKIVLSVTGKSAKVEWGDAYIDGRPGGISVFHGLNTDFDSGFRIFGLRGWPDRPLNPDEGPVLSGITWHSDDYTPYSGDIKVLSADMISEDGRRLPIRIPSSGPAEAIGADAVSPAVSNLVAYFQEHGLRVASASGTGEEPVKIDFYRYTPVSAIAPFPYGPPEHGLFCLVLSPDGKKFSPAYLAASMDHAEKDLARWQLNGTLNERK